MTVKTPATAHAHSARTAITANVDENHDAESRNLLVLIVHHVVLRVAWIFKTESVIMPAFMDHIAGAGWLRGCLPMLNRIGQSAAPLYFADRLRQSEFKWRSLAATTALMAVPFLVLSGLLFADSGPIHAVFPVVFLVLYLLFFAAAGTNQLCFGTIQGKLIRPRRRGRLMAASGFFGSLISIGCAWYLLRTWLVADDGGFSRIFALTGCGFIVSALICFLIVERPDHLTHRTRNKHLIKTALTSLRTERDLRRIAIVAMLFVSSQLLFPHYQALGRLQPGWQPSRLMLWVIAQNAGAGLFGLMAGALADRLGNRITLRLLISGAALTPVLALSLVWWSARYGATAPLYWITFVLLGTVPTTFKILMNYTLEITDRSRHPHYLSTLTLCMALPLLLSPLVGALIRPMGFATVFLTISAMTACGALMTFFIAEPRQTSVHVDDV